MKRARLVTGLLIAVGIITTPCHADILAYEGFDYVEGSLFGQSGGFGWADAWTGGGNAVIAAGSLGYNDGSTDLPTLGNHAIIGGESGSATPIRSMVTELTQQPGTYWISFLGQRALPHATEIDNYTRAAVFQPRLGGASQLSVGKSTRSDVKEWGLYTDSDIDGTSQYSTVDQGDLVFALLQIDIVTGASNDTVSLWINPTLDPNAALGTPDAVNTGVDDYEFDGFRIFTGGSNSSGLYAQMAIDEIRVGTTRQDVVQNLLKEGDTDGNGIVDAADLVPIRTNYRKSVLLRSQGDLDGNGMVDFADFRQFKNGLLAEGMSLSQLDLKFLSVPEPGSLATLVLGVLGIGLLRRRPKAAPLLLAGAVALSGNAAQAVTVIGDDPTGYDIANAAVHTIDPFDTNLVDRDPPSNRGIAGDRKLRQTFQVAETINVGSIVISFDVTGGSSAGSANDTGLGLRFYEVADTLAGSWLPIGQPIAEVLFLDTLPSSDQTLTFNLGPGEVFALPALTGSAGYGIEISTPFASPSDGNPGVIRHSNNTDSTDFYAGGRYYVESGNASNSYRDIGLSIIATETTPCLFGDVNCDGTIDVENDLSAIAANFRKSVTLREEGDLTGNGFVDFDDFDEWKSNYTGSLANIDFGFLSTPEPSAVWLVGLSLGLAGVKRR